MPNLYRFSQAGVNFENHRCCYPSETYVNLPSLVTGSFPSRHGMIANYYLDKNVDPRKRFEGHNVERIEKAQKSLAVTVKLTVVSLRLSQAAFPIVPGIFVVPHFSGFRYAFAIGSQFRV